ncbi:MAG TPA: stage II sporulation protein M [Symbiobacteriaceae bacterium]|jgi:uncharacterized membrane protein SpoIIM required for sporulation|nr:stage II sporulation protein M [Symbiobacteriaceae bacterium]
MNQDQFVARRQQQWQELSRILADMQGRGVRRLPLDVVQQVGRLYRQTASDLAYARTYFPGSPTAGYLNQLVAQAHSLIYAEEPQRIRTLLQFFWLEVPRTVRRHWRAVVLAMALMVLGGVVGCLATLYDRNTAEALVPEAVLNRVVTPEQRYQADVPDRPVEGTIILLNNVRVGGMAFGLGVTLGIGTAVSLFYNGLVVGAVVAHSIWTGDVYSLWAHLMAHGSLELMAIFLCGAAGLILGWSIVAPGDLPRGTAVSQAARQAITLVMGSVPFFVIAATIEGFVTPALGLSVEGKYAVAIITGIAGLAYWVLPGRPRATAAPAP